MKFESSLLQESYQKIRHSSGLTVFVHPKKRATAYACLAARFGSIGLKFRTADEKRFHTVPAGTAHYLEHKLFDNPDGRDSFAVFSDLGADLNAFTSYNVTAYHFSTQENFNTALEELFRLVLNPYFTAASVEKERGIIAEEIRSGLDFPSERCTQNVMAGLYQKNPVRMEIAGSLQSIQKITPEDLYECYRVFYQPSNLILCVCGDVTAEQVMEVVDKALPNALPAKPIIRATYNEPENARKNNVVRRMPVATPLFYLATKDPVLPADPMERLRRDTTMTLLTDLLFSKSSSFYSNLFSSGLLTTSYSAGFSTCLQYAMQTVCGESENPERVRELVLQEVEKTKRKGLDPAAFERVRRVMIADEIRSFDSTESIGNKLLACALESVDLFDFLSFPQSVTIDDCQTLLSTFFVPERMCLSVILPREKSR